MIREMSKWTKACINLIDSNKKLLNIYENTLIDSDLVRIVNEILQIIRGLENSDHWNYILIHKIPTKFDYKFAIKFVYKNSNKNTNYHQITQNFLQINPIVLCFKLDHNSVSTEYITHETHYVSHYDGTDWIHSIDSFVQNNYSIPIHRAVNEWMYLINPNRLNILGIGGESGYYIKHFDKLASKPITAEIYTDNDCIHKDNQRNFDKHPNIMCSKVNYITFHDSYKSHIRVGASSVFEPYVTIVNISKNGLSQYHLTETVAELHSRFIIYIGCSLAAIKLDSDIFEQSYKVRQRIVISDSNYLLLLEIV
jgi:tRNA/tmRNA/rRNA uracil-C5-methylase (TrmA/RlmC/RlmD family)